MTQNALPPPPPNFARFCTPKRCTRVHCLVLKNNPNYVNFFYENDIQLQVAPGLTTHLGICIRTTLPGSTASLHKATFHNLSRRPENVTLYSFCSTGLFWVMRKDLLTSSLKRPKAVFSIDSCSKTTGTRNQFDMYFFVCQSWCAFWQKNDMLLKWSIIKSTSEPKPQRKAYHLKDTALLWDF